MGIKAGLLTPPGVRQWWEAAGRGQVTPEFAELMESTPPGPMFGWTAEKSYVPLPEALGQTDPEDGKG